MVVRKKSISCSFEGVEIPEHRLKNGYLMGIIFKCNGKLVADCVDLFSSSQNHNCESLVEFSRHLLGAEKKMFTSFLINA